MKLLDKEMITHNCSFILTNQNINDSFFLTLTIVLHNFIINFLILTTKAFQTCQRLQKEKIL